MEEPGVFSALFDPIVSILSKILGGFYFLTEQFGVGNYGLAIILLTVVIKIILYPLTVKQLNSMRAMQKIQPELKKLQEKYKDKPQIMQQKLMQMYQKEGVNPMAGCLPLLIQMPILMAMYYTLYNFDYGAVEPSFLWLPSLSQTDPLYILPLLSALTTFLQQKIATVSTAEQSQQMKMMMYIMPIFIGWISLNFPAGLVLYWVTMNVVQILQQLWMYRNENSDKEAA